MGSTTGVGVVLRLVAGLVLVIVVLAGQTRRIVRAELPELRAAEALGIVTPTSDTARIIVSMQMLLDLVIIGAVVRLLINAAESGLSRTGDTAIEEE